MAEVLCDSHPCHVLTLDVRTSRQVLLLLIPGGISLASVGGQDTEGLPIRKKVVDEDGSMGDELRVDGESSVLQESEEEGDYP